MHLQRATAFLIYLSSLAPIWPAHAGCRVQETLQVLTATAGSDASARVNDDVLRVLNQKRKRLGLSALASVQDGSSKEYAQAFLSWMRSLEPRVKSIQGEIDQIVSRTKLDELKRLEKLATDKQIIYYQRLQEEIAELKVKATPEALLKAKNKEQVLFRDGIALGNGPHVAEVMHHIESNRNSILVVLKKNHPFQEQELEHYFQYLKTLAAVHDLGKTFPDKLVGKGASLIAKDGGNVFLTERIAFHEFSSAVRLKEFSAVYGFDQKTVDSLIRNIVGHNDGSGLPDVFWNAVAFPEKTLGLYPKPETLASRILALADRGGQATLGSSGGVFKITRQELAKKPVPKIFGRTLLEETMNKSGTNTIRQINAISKSIGLGLEQSEMVKTLISAQKSALDAFQAIHWNPDGISGEIAGHPFQNSEEFFKFVNETDARMKLPDHAADHLPEDYWLTHHIAQ